MATRSPTPFHSFWGAYATGGLPTSGEVEVGDTAFDTTLGQLVVCTAVGPVVWTSVGGGVTGVMLALGGTATGGAVAYISAVYLPAGITLTAASQAYIGGSAIGDSTTLSLVAIGGGPALATWTISGTLGVATVAGPPVVIPAGWYDLTLQETANSGVAFARGLYLA